MVFTRTCLKLVFSCFIIPTEGNAMLYTATVRNNFSYTDIQTTDMVLWADPSGMLNLHLYKSAHGAKSQITQWAVLQDPSSLKISTVK